MRRCLLECAYLGVKRAFLFSCNCGLRLSDVRALKWKDIYSDNGTWKVATRMKKTENVVYIPLPGQALKWLPDTERNADSNVFPDLTPYALSKYLKPWVKEAGIMNKNVSYHTARHSGFSFSLKFNSLQNIFSLTGNDLETSEILYFTSFCSNSKERFS